MDEIKACGCDHVEGERGQIEVCSRDVEMSRVSVSK